MFIVIEGIDGSGKSTQANLLTDYFHRSGQVVVNRSHPANDNIFGRLTKKSLLRRGGIPKIGSAFFYLFDVLRSVFLYYGRKDRVIIFQRYLLGTAYTPRPLHLVFYAFFASTLPTPDLKIMLDVSPQEAHSRIASRSDELEVYENPVELEKKRDKMLELATGHGWKIIPADGDKHDINDMIIFFLR